jgi:uncharacterized protein (TIGR02466 family)|tara:strand:- start:578 stop:1159 length:582 start_codon:yes stop_codon:yes gene_type:complete
MSITIVPPEYLFPIKILTSYDTSFDSYKKDLIGWMLDYSKRNETSERSNYGGYQSQDQFYFEESFAPYLNKITEHITSTAEQYCEDTIIEPDSLKLSNMWFNLNYNNCYNVTHTHPGCILAGVLWIQCPDDSSKICFEDPNSFASATITNDTHRRFTPTAGTMALFPSYIPHRVDINHSHETRISISFNLYQP